MNHEFPSIHPSICYPSYFISLWCCKSLLELQQSSSAHRLKRTQGLKGLKHKSISHSSNFEYPIHLNMRVFGLWGKGNLEQTHLGSLRILKALYWKAVYPSRNWTEAPVLNPRPQSSGNQDDCGASLTNPQQCSVLAKDSGVKKIGELTLLRENWSLINDGWLWVLFSVAHA